MPKKSNSVKKKTIIKLPFIKFKKGQSTKFQMSMTKITVSGILFTCILLSICSGFVDLVFFSGLSKSKFHVGTFQIAAAILYTVISLGFTSGKFWCAMQIGMLKELRTRLEAKGIAWAKNISKALTPWQVVHKFLIMVSIITALSLSVNSIGSGIRTMEQTIKNMTYDAQTLISLNNSINEGVRDKRAAAKENIDGQKNAQETAKEEVSLAWQRIADYQSALDKIDNNSSLSINEKARQKFNLRKSAVERAPKGVNSSNIDYMTQTQLRSIMQAQAMENESLDTTSLYEEGIEYDKAQVEETLRAIADKEYKTPDGELIHFVLNDGTLVNIQTAISRLQVGISRWQSDTGDVGESSKIFTLIATYMNADVKAGGMGVSEWMMMVLIAIFGIVQEFLIYIFTPKAVIDRKLLSQVSQYLRWKDEVEKERFLISVYKDYVGDGIINREDYEAKCKKCVELMEESEDDIIKKFSKKVEPLKVMEASPIVEKPTMPTTTRSIPGGYSDKVDNLVAEIEELI